MKTGLSSRRPLIAMLAAVSALLWLPAQAGAATGATHAMAPAVTAGEQFEYAGSVADGLVRFPCQLAAFPVHCYGPDQIRAAYGIQPLLDRGIVGRGRTIVLIDAFQSPTIQQDLTLFDRIWNLPDPVFHVIAPDGLTAFDPTSHLQLGWAGEISLDVEWAHAMAPGAAIELVLARSESDVDLLRATRYAVRHNLGDVIAMSFGEAETCAGKAVLDEQHEVYREAVERGITLVASSGDQGAARPGCNGASLVKSVSTPASDPSVTGVGGTLLTADLTSGTYAGEVAWGDTVGASGGGFSAAFERPGFQSRFVGEDAGRGVPDVAFVASEGSGVLVAFGATPLGPGRVFLMFGTSEGAPAWAGVIALADQVHRHRLGSINQALYRIARAKSGRNAFHDITSGSNAFHGIAGFSAGAGWDPVTGLGTPNVAKLVPLLGGSEDS